jgi:hypothetical protein
MGEVRKVAVLELKRLFIELHEHRPDICIRYRLMGQMWAQNFLRIVDFTGDGVLLNDEASHRMIAISNLTNIMQFELDKTFRTFQAYCHYEVVTIGEWI